jgi:hypothetical protein
MFMRKPIIPLKLVITGSVFSRYLLEGVRLWPKDYAVSVFYKDKLHSAKTADFKRTMYTSSDISEIRFIS